MGFNYKVAGFRKDFLKKSLPIFLLELGLVISVKTT